MCVCMYVCVYVCMCMYVYVCVCTYMCVIEIDRWVIVSMIVMLCGTESVGDRGDRARPAMAL